MSALVVSHSVPAVAPAGEALDEALALVLDELITRLASRAAGRSPAQRVRRPRALDCGGGSGRRAVPLARHGADVTVMDASIDALAILHRRAIEAGVADHVEGVQADVEDMQDLVAAASFDLVLVHDVLSSINDPTPVVAGALRAVAPTGYISVVLANPVAAVLSRALSGELDAAVAELDAQEHPHRSQLTLEALQRLVEADGFEAITTRGLGAISSLVPGAVLDGRPGAGQALIELDRRCSTRSPFREIAGQLHLLARRPG